MAAVLVCIVFFFRLQFLNMCYVTNNCQTTIRYKNNMSVEKQIHIKTVQQINYRGYLAGLFSVRNEN